MTVPQSPRPELTVCTPENRLCSGYDGISKLVCREMHDGWECSRQLGHDGYHVACTGPHDHEEDCHNLATWPNDSQPAPTEGGDEPCAQPSVLAELTKGAIPPVTSTAKESASNAATQGAALGAAGGEPRLLEWGEIIQEGDEVFAGGEWSPVQLSAGSQVGRGSVGFYRRSTPVPAPSVAVRPADLNTACDCGFYYGKHSGDCPAASSSSPEDRDAGGIVPPSLIREVYEVVHELHESREDMEEAMRTDDAKEQLEEVDEAIARARAAEERLFALLPRFYPFREATPLPVAPVAREETATPETDEARKFATKALLCTHSGIMSLILPVLSRLHAAEAERDAERRVAIEGCKQFDIARAEVARLKEEALKNVGAPSNEQAAFEIKEARTEISRLSGELKKAKENANAMRRDVYKAEDICVKLNAALAAATARTEELEKLLPFIKEMNEANEDMDEALRTEDPREQNEEVDEAIFRHRAAEDALILLATRPATPGAETTGEKV